MWKWQVTPQEWCVNPTGTRQPQTWKILQEELPVCKILGVYGFVKLDSEILSFKEQNYLNYIKGYFCVTFGHVQYTNIPPPPPSIQTKQKHNNANKTIGPWECALFDQTWILLHPRMLFATFGWIWPSVSRDCRRFYNFINLFFHISLPPLGKVQGPKGLHLNYL